MHNVDRRLAAILAADVAGYSRLMEADEEGTIEQLRLLRANVFIPNLDQFRGRIANTAGDSFLIEFASAVDAVRYALLVQEKLKVHNQPIDPVRRLEFRIGINVGDIVAEGDDLLGDGVNVAARIEALADIGGICISRSVCDQVQDRINIPLVDLGEIEVKNIARPVHVFRVDWQDLDSRSNTMKSARIGSRKKPAILAALVTSALLLAVVGWFNSDLVLNPLQQDEGLSTGPSIAVLPFTNRSGDPEQSYFVEGIWEDITTDLSKVTGLSVASSSSVIRFKPGAVSNAEIAQTLGVHHLLEASVRRSKEKIRISTRLIDAKSGKQIWAERFDRQVNDLFAVQDEITERVVSQLSSLYAGSNLTAQVRAYTPNLEAYDLYIKGRAQRIPPTPKNLAAAQKSFAQAMSLDPQFAGGYAGASQVQLLTAFGAGNSPQDYKNKMAGALELAQKAVALDPQFGPGWGSLAEVRFRLGEFDVAIEAVKKAIALAPSDSLMRANYGRYLGYMGRGEEGAEQVKSAMRMSPDSLPMLYFLAINYRAQDKPDLAVETLLEHRKRLGGRILPAPTAQLIAAQMQAGDTPAAKATAELLFKQVPKFTTRLAARAHVYQYQTDQKEFADFLQQAGIPR